MAGPAAISTGTLGTYLPPIVCMYVLKRAPAWFRVGKKEDDDSVPAPRPLDRANSFFRILLTLPHSLT